MANDILVSLGWVADIGECAKSVAFFWGTPLGLFISGSIVFSSFIRVSHPKGNQGFFDSIWHLCFGLTGAAGFIGGLTATYPTQVLKSMLILMAIRGIVKAVRVFRI